jgi:hypothetical protein
VRDALALERKPAIPSRIIADRAAAPPRPRALGAFIVGIACATLAAGGLAAWYYSAMGLTLSHYDAKAHLVVARRVFDGLTPGWWQIGAVWLPLPHLLNMLPVQADELYRSGLSGVVISVASFVLASTSMAWMVARGTGSLLAGASAAIVFASDPNTLYLQSTPMTEPLLLGLTALSLALVYRWVEAGGIGTPHGAGWAMAGACLTRYEAWPVTALLLALAAFVLMRRGTPFWGAIGRVLRVALYPLAALVGFLFLSRATVGEWFVTGGFFVVDNDAHGRPWRAAQEVWWGLRQVVGTGTLALAVASGVAITLAGLTRARWAPALLSLALVGTAALPWYAFYEGHPFRIRYMIVLGAVVAVGLGWFVGLLSGAWRPLAAAVVVGLALYETPPMSPRAPMVAEAQWDRPYSIGRAVVTRCLVAGFQRPEHKILASMGSLAHYMQELSHTGFAIRDFIHEGNDELWNAALVSPRRFAQWVLFEERAEGGDMLTARRRASPAFVEGFDRVCEGGGVALYRRSDVPPQSPDGPPDR